MEDKTTIAEKVSKQKEDMIADRVEYKLP